MKKLELEIVTQIEQLKRHLDEVQASLRSLDNSVRISGRRLSDSLHTTFSRLKNFIFSIQGVITAFTAGAVGMITKTAISAAADFEKQLMTLRTVSLGTGASLREIANIIKTYAGGLFSPEDVMRAVTYARSVGLQLETIKKLLPYLKDTAAAYGEDLQVAMMAVVRAMRFGEAELAERIGLTLRENAILETTLRLYGKRLSQLTQEQKEIAVLTAAIQQMSKFRGAEAQAMETAWGQWQKIRIAYREMLITLGQALLPLVKSVAPVVVNLFKSISTGVLHLQIFYLEQKKKIQKEALKDLEGWRNWHKLFGLFFKSSREKVKLYEEAIKAQRERIAETGKEIAKLREQLGKGTAAYSEALESLEKAEKFAGKIGAHQKGLADNLSKLLEKTKDSKKKVREEVRKSATHFVEFASLFERITGGFERTPLPIEKTTLSLGNFAKKLNTSSLFLKGLAVPIEKVRTATGGLTEQVQAMTSMLSEEELWISKVLNRFEEMAGYMVEVLPTVSETLTSFYSQHQEGLMRLGSATRVFTLGMRESLRELAAAFVDYLVNKISVAMLEIMAEKVKNIFILIAKGLAGELTAFARIPLLLAEFASTLAALAAIKAAASALKGSIRKMQFGGWVSTPFALAEKGEFVLPRPTAEKFLRFLEIVGERYYKIETPRIINITINTSAAWNTQELESLARKVSRLLR